MSFIAVQEAQTCLACSGTGTGRWDPNEGRRAPCDHCDGSGSVVTCLNSGGDYRPCLQVMPAPEAEEHGEYCRACRKELDIPAAAE